LPLNSLASFAEPVVVSVGSPAREDDRRTIKPVQFVLNPDIQRLSIIFPIGKKRFRTYWVFRRGAFPPLSGGKDPHAFVEESIVTGAPANWFRGGEPIGPLASFNAPDSWADRPYCNGVVLIDDAAAASDPCFGCGLSLTLRDVRVLGDRLTAMADFAAAADTYAAEHDRYYGALRRIHGWFRDLWFGAGAEAEALRTRALPKIAEDPSRVPDLLRSVPKRQATRSHGVVCSLRIKGEKPISYPKMIRNPAQPHWVS
jgi:2-polyprenyl-6-methoxyphenol hydroxylase-like FAD-dependent oxidoreductase